MIEMKNATWIKNDHTEVRRFSFVADNGKLTAICGRTGSGKTALVESVMGLRPLVEGYVSVDGELLTPATACFFRTHMSYVPQTLHTPGRLTARQLLGLYGHCVGHPSSALSQEGVQPMWEELGLDRQVWAEPLYHQPVDVVKRVLLAFALSAGRPMLVADEPTEWLSDDDARRVTTLLRRQADAGHVVLVATSHPELVGVAHHMVSV